MKYDINFSHVMAALEMILFTAGNCEHLWAWFSKQQINKQLLQFVFTFLRSVATVKFTRASYHTQFLIFHIGFRNKVI